MRYRALGRTGITISEIGFGAWGIGGDSYGETDDNQSKGVLHCALEQGITFFDTSDIYGAGHSEDLIGEALSPHRDSIIIATKGGALPHTGKQMPQDFSAVHMQKALEDSLHRLKTDYIDLYQLHSPGLEHLTDELLSTLREFMETGKVRALGVSVRSPGDGLAILDRYAFDAVQVNFNLMDQRAFGNGLFGIAAERGAGIIARTPFNFGFLGGRLRNLGFGEKDHRRHWSMEQLQLWSDSSALFDGLCGNGKRTRAQLALQFCLSFDAVSVVIPGMLKRDEVLENAAASSLPPLTTDEIMAIKHIYATNTFVYDSVKKETLNERYDQERQTE